MKTINKIKFHLYSVYKSKKKILNSYKEPKNLIPLIYNNKRFVLGLFFTNRFLEGTYKIKVRGLLAYFSIRSGRKLNSLNLNYDLLNYYSSLYKRDFIMAGLYHLKIRKNHSEIFKLNYTQNSGFLADVKKGYHVNQPEELGAILRNKKITVVGPAKIPLTYQDKKSLISSDIIIGTNIKSYDVFLESLGLENKEALSSKSIISVWNGEQYRFRLANDMGFEKNIIHLFRPGSAEKLVKFNLDFFGLSTTPRIGTMCNPNMLQNILSELMLYSFSKVYVCGADLMLTVRRQLGYYFDNRENNRIEGMRTSFLSHDPAEQFLILEEFLKDTRVEYNHRLNGIISGGLDEYFLCLHRVYGVS